MSEGTVRTQGTHLFVIEPFSASALTLTKLSCPTGINGLGGPKDQIEDTCLDTIGDKTFKAGLGNPGPVSVPFNLIPRETSHQILFEMKESGELMDWVACLSESATPPTLDSADEFELPTDRTCITFSAYVADVNIDIATNEIVRGTLTLQRSGNVGFFPFVPS